MNLDLRKHLMFLMLFVFAGKAWAQSLFFTGEAGMGIAYVTQMKFTNSDRAPVMGANASVSILAPFSKKIFLETGLELNQKGYKSDIDILSVDYPENIMRYTAAVKRTYLNIPLVISGRILHKSKHQMFAGGGMNFGFALQGAVDGTYEYYRGTIQTGAQPFNYSERIGLIQSRDKQGHEKIDLYRFNAGIKVQVRYVFHDRYTARLFYELNLGDAVASSDVLNSDLLQQYTGFSIGVIFPKVKN